MKMIILFLLYFIKYIYSGIVVSEPYRDEETESECVNTKNPKESSECFNKAVLEEDKYCCLFEIETHKKEVIKTCSALDEFQYNHIRLYVKEKMDELYYRDFHINCNSLIIGKNMLYFTLFSLFILF